MHTGNKGGVAATAGGAATAGATSSVSDMAGAGASGGLELQKAAVVVAGSVIAITNAVVLEFGRWQGEGRVGGIIRM